jgi:hypothetical protein
MSVTRMHRGQSPMPEGGTFSSNGYDLQSPSRVDSYVLRPVPNARPGLGASVEEYQATLEKALFGQKKTLSPQEKRAEEIRIKTEMYDLEQQQLKIEAKQASLYGLVAVGAVGLLGLTIFLWKQRTVAE